MRTTEQLFAALLVVGLLASDAGAAGPAMDRSARLKLSGELSRWAATPNAGGYWGKGPAPVTVRFVDSPSPRDLAWLRAAVARLGKVRGDQVDVRIDRRQLATIAADRRIEAAWIDYWDGLTNRQISAIAGDIWIQSWFGSGEPFTCSSTRARRQVSSPPRINAHLKRPANRRERARFRKLAADEVSPDWFVIEKVSRAELRVLSGLAVILELKSDCNGPGIDGVEPIGGDGTQPW